MIFDLEEGWSVKGFSAATHAGSLSSSAFCGGVFSYYISFCCQSLIAKEHITSAQGLKDILPLPVVL